MKARKHIRAVCLVASAVVGIGALSACDAKSNEPAPTSSPSLSPTSKGSLPGPNNFSPAPIAPLTPTASPGNGTTAHP